MTNTITRKQIESWRNTLSLHSEFPELDAIFDLALQAVDMHPRPIADAPQGEVSLVLVRSTSEFRLLRWNDYNEAHYSACCGERVDKTDIEWAIPLSGLSRVKP